MRALSYAKTGILFALIFILAGCNSRGGTTQEPTGQSGTDRPAAQDSGSALHLKTKRKRLAAGLPDHAPRLVLVFGTCTVNKNYLGVHNPAVPYTPNLVRFAKDAIVFDKHRTEAGQSGISFASLFSGGQAPLHGAFSHPHKMSTDVYDMSEAFAGNGYETFSWFPHKMIRKLNYGQGVLSMNQSWTTLTASDESFNKVLEQLRNDKEYRAMILTAFSVTHRPYTSIPRSDTFQLAFPDECKVFDEIGERRFYEYANLYQKNSATFSHDFSGTVERLQLTPEDVGHLAKVVDVLYKICVYRLDKMFGDLVDQIDKYGLLEEAIIVFTADHGESMYQGHDRMNWSHGWSLKADVLDVPLMIRFQGLDQGRFEHVTRNIDVFPTLAGMSGIRLPDDVSLEGVDLSTAIRQQEPAPELLAFSHTGGLTHRIKRQNPESLRTRYFPTQDIHSAWVAVRKGDLVWKWTHRGGVQFEFEAFDLNTDPEENNNLFDSANPVDREMAKKLTRYKEWLVAGHQMWTTQETPADSLDISDMLRRLKSLGYID